MNLADLAKPHAVQRVAFVTLHVHLGMAALARSNLKPANAVILLANANELCGRRVAEWCAQVTGRPNEWPARLKQGLTVFAAAVSLRQAKRILGGQEDLVPLLDRVPAPGMLRVVGCTADGFATMHMPITKEVPAAGDA